MVDILQSIVGRPRGVRLQALEQNTLIPRDVDDVNALDTRIFDLLDGGIGERLILASQNRLRVEIDDIVFEDF